MSVDREEVERIAGLARLELEDDEAARLTSEMNRILDHAERLRGVSAEASGASGIAGASGIEGAEEGRASGVREEDVTDPDALHAEPASFAPDWREGFFVVPPPPGVTAEDDPRPDSG